MLLFIHASPVCPQCRDGKKVVLPHVVSLSVNMDRGILAVLFNSLQQSQTVDSKQTFHQRTVHSGLFTFSKFN